MNYKPGQIAKATVRGVRDVTIVRHDYRPGHNAYSVTFEWFDITTASWVPSVDVTDVRPLVVLDLSESDTLALIADLRRAVGTRLACAIADQIEAQIRPAIEEPKGLGAVVEDDKGAKFVRVADPIDGWMAGRDWQRIGGDINAVRNFGWSEITPVRVLSEGVPS